MDVFSQTQQTSETANNQEQTMTLDSLVGEGKKYKTAEDALNAMPHAQMHISKLEAELAMLRQQANQAKGVEEILKRLEGNSNAASGRTEPVTSQKVEGTTSPTGLTAEEVRQMYSNMKREEMAELNRSRANDMVIAKYGANDAKHKLMEQATALNMTVEAMQDIATQSPAAFERLLNDTSTSSGSMPSTMSATLPDQHRDSSRAASTEVKYGTMKYYDAIKRTDPAKYWSSAVQKELHTNAMKLGEAFFQ